MGNFQPSSVGSYLVYTKGGHKTPIRRFPPDLEVFLRSRKKCVLDLMNFSQLEEKFLKIAPGGSMIKSGKNKL